MITAHRKGQRVYFTDEAGNQAAVKCGNVHEAKAAIRALAFVSIQADQMGTRFESVHAVAERVIETVNATLWFARRKNRARG